MIGATFHLRGDLTGARRYNSYADEYGLTAIEVNVHPQGGRAFEVGARAVEILVPTVGVLYQGSLRTPPPLAPAHQLEGHWIDVRGHFGRADIGPDTERLVWFVNHFEYLGASQSGRARPWPTLDQLSERNAWMIGEGPEPEWMR